MAASADRRKSDLTLAESDLNSASWCHAPSNDSDWHSNFESASPTTAGRLFVWLVGWKFRWWLRKSEFALPHLSLSLSNPSKKVKELKHTFWLPSVLCLYRMMPNLRKFLFKLTPNYIRKHRRCDILWEYRANGKEIIRNDLLLFCVCTFAIQSRQIKVTSN